MKRWTGCGPGGRLLTYRAQRTARCTSPRKGSVGDLAPIPAATERPKCPVTLSRDRDCYRDPSIKLSIMPIRFNQETPTGSVTGVSSFRGVRGRWAARRRGGAPGCGRYRGGMCRARRTVRHRTDYGSRGRRRTAVNGPYPLDQDAPGVIARGGGARLAAHVVLAPRPLPQRRLRPQHGQSQQGDRRQASAHHDLSKRRPLPRGQLPQPRQRIQELLLGRVVELQHAVFVLWRPIGPKRPA